MKNKDYLTKYYSNEANHHGKLGNVVLIMLCIVIIIGLVGLAIV
jgi:hypothetical protein